MLSFKRKLELADPSSNELVKAMKRKTDYKICKNIDEYINVKLISANAKYDCNEIFLITRLRYDNGFLYLFLTGTNNVQFYYKTRCTIHSYKRCFHNRTPCPNKCKPHKSMVVTGLKQRECHRINVYKIDRETCRTDEPFLLDDFCSNENRVQMQLQIYEGEYIRFAGGVKVNENCCAVGDIKAIIKVPLSELKEEISLIVGCYDIETYTNLNSFSNAKVDPVISIAYVLKTQTDIHRFCFINTAKCDFTLADEVLHDEEHFGEKIIVVSFDNERDMLKSFLKLMFKSNPDDILDYNGDKFDLPYILQRASILNIDKKFISRYDLKAVELNTVTVHTKFGYSFENYFMTYFNHLDVYQYIKNSFDANKIENLKLNTTASFYLKVGKIELSIKEMMALYHKKEFAKIIQYNVRDCVLPIEMFFKCKMANKMYADAALLYMSRDDSNLTIWRKINLALFNRAIVNVQSNGQPDEYFFNKFDLNKVMQRKKTPCIPQSDEEEIKDEDQEGELIDYGNLDRKRVPTHQIPDDAIALCDLKARIKYMGGKVLSPVPGYYKLIFTLDFSQLYTSIMIHHTTCLSNLFYGADNKLYLQHNDNAIATKFLKDMAEKRALYKAEMKNYNSGSFEYQMYDSWQNAAKLVCNSKYGWIGLCCKPLANFITAQGRIKLTEAQDFIKSLSDNEHIKKKWNLTVFRLEVVYGDTDSNFVSAYILPEEFTRMGGVNAFEKLIRSDILHPLNALWKGAFKMELENIMDGMLIKGKKMYMCLKSNGTLYKRGFNVKKDSPLFLRDAFDDVGKQLLSLHSLDCVLKNLVSTIKLKRDRFCADNCDEYAFSQTLNELKNGSGGGNITTAYVLYMQLRNNANTKYIPSSGDRIPYLLIDKPCIQTVRDRAKPIQLFTDNDAVNWSKHLGILCTFFNDLMSMLGNDSMFVYAFQEISTYLQKDQSFDILYPTIKKLTQSRIKDILCKELNVKNKKKITDSVVKSTFDNNEQKFIHSYEFSLTKRKPTYKLDVNSFVDCCPVCTGKGLSAVDKKMSLRFL